ncbi:MAG: 4'-phosphopantetheinyl transferase [Oscillibacter sp.]|jgi:4'-phosphopantetheinyl transferase|nr:4'-phosphopantetheinyl transferase [Oscillibacter sp.]
MAVEIWAARLIRPLREDEDRALTALLPPERAARLQRSRNTAGRAEALCAYALLLELLQSRYGWERLPEVALSKTGKPWFPACPEACFSLSHTAGAAAAAVHDRPVGVDLERLRPVSPRLLRRTEARDPETFFRDWVRREALSKKKGGNLAELFKEPSVPPGVFYFPLELFPGYAAGAAGCDSAPPEVRLRTQEELLL